MILLAFRHEDGLRLAMKRGDEMLDVTALAGSLGYLVPLPSTPPPVNLILL